MSEIQYEQCDLEEATHVEVSGKVHELHVREGSFFMRDYEDGLLLGILVEEDGEIANIPISLFPIFFIKPLKKIKQEPAEFEAVFYQPHEVCDE